MTAPMFHARPAALAAALVLGLLLAGCKPAPDEAAPTAAPAAAPPADAAAGDAQAADALAALSVDELRQRASVALRDQRLYGPAGANAMEYYLAIREKSETPNVVAESALMDLLPYALIGAEQAIVEGDFAEAERLAELMARTDAEAPALPRIREAIVAGRNTAAERARLAEERARQAAEAQRQAAAQAAAPPVAVPTPAPTPAPVAVAPEPEPAPPPVAAAPAPVAAAPAPVRTGPPRAISTPQPPYPREAARTRASGTVVVQFTIGADGRVTEVNVIRARPRGLFEDAVVDTVRTWRFEPPGEPVTMTRTFDFRM
ncbi:MAG: energy transducer TonB [Xanthomonadaceae bacterium]|jgi:protein TonB|nr:energy transducer TonB [Xanthomonadaceae bacterium]